MDNWYDKLGQLLDALLVKLNKLHLDGFIQGNQRYLTSTGLIGIHSATILGFILAILYGFKMEMALVGVGGAFAWVVLSVLGYYSAWKFLPIIDGLIESTPTYVRANSLFNVISLIFCLLGIISLAGGTFLAVTEKDTSIFWMGLFSFIGCEYVTALSLNPNLINVKISADCGPGEEFFGLATFFLKSLLKLTPSGFGSWIFFGNIYLLFLFNSGGLEFMANATAALTFLSAAFLPLVSYITFLVYYVTVDVLLAILSLHRIGEE